MWLNYETVHDDGLTSRGIATVGTYIERFSADL